MIGLAASQNDIRPIRASLLSALNPHSQIHFFVAGPGECDRNVIELVEHRGVLQAAPDNPGRLEVCQELSVVYSCPCRFESDLRRQYQTPAVSWERTRRGLNALRTDVHPG